MENDNRLDELLMRWEELQEQGNEVRLESFCRDCPELLGPLAERIRAIRVCDEFLTADRVETTVSSYEVSEQTPDFVVAESPYKLVRHHASGGMGDVHVARDELLDRDVALKLTRQGTHQNQVSRRSFLREARVTGRLEHPGIVPIYDLGEDSNGRSFYSMRFVSGASLLRSILDFHSEPVQPNTATRNLGFRELLRSFINVCNTIHYANSRGVVHCDIKPENILIGEYGETFVVDWGLARQPSCSDTPDDSLSAWADDPPVGSQSGAAMGTPAYMSPEQARGDQQSLSNSTDVYCLGATLYMILTGERPIRGESLLNIIQNAQAANFTRPHEVNKHVPRALDSICVKAMSLNPTDRYHSAHHLANDIECWLADEPVSVYRGTMLERVARYCRQHKSLVSSVFVTLVIISLALGVGTIVLRREQLKTEQARQDAIRNYRQTREVVDEFFTKVSEDQLLNQPGMQPLLKELLAGTVSHYRRFVQEHKKDPLLVLELARAYRNLALATSLLGSSEEALDLFTEELRIRQQLAIRSPNNLDFQWQISQTHHNIGTYQTRTGLFEEAALSFGRAIEMKQKIVQQGPGKPEWLSSLAMSLGNEGTRLLRSGDQQAIGLLLESLTIQERLVQQHPNDYGIAFYYATTKDNLGLAQIRLGQINEATESFETALRYFNACAKQSSDLALIQLNELNVRYARCQIHASQCYNTMGIPQKAAQQIDEALSMLKQLVRENPKVEEFQLNLATAHLHHGILLYELEQDADALDEYESASQIYRNLLSSSPDVPLILGNLAVCLTNAATIHMDRRDWAQAEPVLRETAEIYARFPPRTLPISQNYSDILARNAEVNGHLGNTDEVVQFREGALDLLTKLHSQEQSAETAMAVGQALLLLGHAHGEKEDWDQEATSYRKGIDHLRNLSDLLKSSPSYDSTLLNLYNDLIEVLRKQTKEEEADKVGSERDSVLGKPM